ncbi:aminoglycoside phosphotransferase family protein [Amycolatopsis mongoliensis]|uniref:Aminoglycoside phosphotransferase family protein n=1 Tax=Amycolatopsis mongoliensis TaxID=715475 RepID=A0A9Y2JRX7_9PSEU|nr:aminoglycoside phosphotransferase family protein [Amycolatopsis sp. 4-36]WIY01849.1 aminoglycoside phosphotransferase family protein [Amycolatopsis sp. 4-36]
MTDLDAEQHARAVLEHACAKAGRDATDAEVVRLGENAIFRLTDGVIARVSRPGQLAAARKEVAVARWLESVDVPAVQVADQPDQPIDVDGRAVTFWLELPPHEHGSPVQVAQALRRLHGVVPPSDLDLGPIQPFVRLAERIERASTLAEADRDWLRSRLAELRKRWDDRPGGLPECVVHGDAWVGNVVSTADGRVVFLDLERVAIGAPEWDLVHTAIKYRSFGWIGESEYQAFRTAYGHDVTNWSGFELFRDIREFRMTCMAVQVASENHRAEEQALWRLRCLQGQHGARPWNGWSALP